MESFTNELAKCCQYASAAEVSFHGSASPRWGVLVAGGGKIAGFVDHRDAQIYSPPYLFMGPRPTINGIVSQRGNDIVQYGESFTVVTSNTDVTRVTLTRLPSMSHSLDWNQRFDELSNVVKVAGGYQVTAPPNKNVCPPGYYYLHLLNNKGVPSVARIIQIPVS